MMASAALVLVDARPAARVLTLNRPDKLNALDVPLQSALLAAIRAAATDPEVRAVVLTGAGRAFCAGGDYALLAQRLSGTPMDPAVARLHEDLAAAFHAVDVPLVAAVNGPAVGMGAELVAWCDLVVMSEDAQLCEPHARFGLPPLPGVRDAWLRATSRLKVNEFVLTARRIGAAEAVALGLANRIVPAGEALTAALALADEIAAHPRAGVTAAKHALRAAAPVIGDVG